MPSSDIHLETQYVTGMEKRLRDRLNKIMTAVYSHSCDPSISNITNAKSERDAIYSFWSNKNVSANDILRSHARMTEERSQSHDVVLFAQDTTEITLQRSIVKNGSTHSKSTFGFFIHPLLAITPDGTPLGCLAHKIWVRDENRPVGAERDNMLRHTPFEEKESYRWYEAYREMGEFAKRHPNVTSICLADSEADIYEFYAKRRPSRNAHFIIRARHDRFHVDKNNGAITRLRKKLDLSRLRGTIEITARERSPNTKSTGKRHEPRDKRRFKAEVRACSLHIQRPDRNQSPRNFVSLKAVLVKEINPPKGERPIEWILLTTLPIKTNEDVMRIVKYYKMRWQIEIFFRTLKGGCAIEKRRFRSFKSIETCASLLMIIAWHIMTVTYMARKHPEESCEVYFEPDEWKGVYFYVDETIDFPKDPPTMGEFIVKLAMLSGYSPQSKYPPGVRTIWRSIFVLAFTTAYWKKVSRIFGRH